MLKPWDWETKVITTHPNGQIRENQVATTQHRGLALCITRTELFDTASLPVKTLTSSFTELGFGTPSKEWHEVRDENLLHSATHTMQSIDAYLALKRCLERKPAYQWLFVGSEEGDITSMSFQLIDEEHTLLVEQCTTADERVSFSLVYFHPFSNIDGENGTWIAVEGAVIGEHFQELREAHQQYLTTPKAKLRSQILRALKDESKLGFVYELPGPDSPESQSVYLSLTELQIKLSRHRFSPSEDWEYRIELDNASHLLLGELNAQDFDQREIEWLYHFVKHADDSEEAT